MTTPQNLDQFNMPISSVYEKMSVGTVLAVPSAAITTTQTSADLSVGQYHVLTIDVSITAVSGTTPSYFLTINRKGADGVYYPVFTGSNRTAVDTISLSIGVGASTNIAFMDTIQIVETITGTTPSFTRSMSVKGK